jgi:hypothetical protein
MSKKSNKIPKFERWEDFLYWDLFERDKLQHKYERVNEQQEESETL